ncbi:Oxoglutarate/iron-dependent dioxygenase [uncultured Caudovirales phage]|uniref:Oxoglutarate/iron-dependent dioxygenase n=1 Tax=uncultured Caudovirales phage TaxID=2100421 RepID=A0A6J5PB44_9CAUD|nr:Oxoglutarate/iron-dependent dioxygenase [uncultured Caudovirales phage]
MYKIDERYYRPTVKKIDNITTKLGIDTKNISIVENFLPQDEVKFILNELKKHEPEYDTSHTHGKGLSYTQIDNKVLKYFASYISPLIAKHATNFYNMNQITDIDVHYAFHPAGSYLNPHTDVIGWAPKHDENNEYSTIEKYFPYYWSGHLANILYLNDDYEGGELFFPDFKFEIRPKSGMLISFPGNTHYLHGVRETSGNTRYSCSLWTKFEDFDNTI